MKAVASYRALLSNGPLARLLLGEFASGIGNWLYLVGLMVLIYRVSGPGLLGVVGAARILPYVVFSIPAGMIADRFDRRYVLLVSDVARALLMLVLAWLAAANGPPLAMVAVAIVATSFATLFYPAIGALLPSMVRDETEFGPANSAWQTLDMVAFVVGPALGGLLIAGNELPAAFLLNAVSFGVIAIVLWTLPDPKARKAQAAVARGDSSIAGTEPATSAPGESVADAGGGEPGPVPAAKPSLLTLPRRPMAGVLAIDLAASFVNQGLFTLLVILATEVYSGGDAAVGYLNAAIGVGGVAGAIVAGVLVLRRSLAPALLAGAIVGGVAVVLLGITHLLIVGFALVAVTAAAAIAIDVADATVFQRIVPDELRGRGQGVWMSISTTFAAAGALLTPTLFGAVGLLPLMVGLGALLLLGGLAAVRLIGPAAVREPTALERQLLRAAHLPVFAGLSVARLDHVLNAVKPIRYTAGEVIIRQGDAADLFYILSEGHVEVTAQASPSSPSRVIGNLGPDEVFGELGLLNNAPRMATVTAKDDVLVLAMKGRDFLGLVTGGVGVATRFLDLYRPANEAIAAQDAALAAAAAASE